MIEQKYQDLYHGVPQVHDLTRDLRTLLVIHQTFFFPHVLLPFENKEVFTRLSVYSIYICELLLFIKLYSYL